MNESQRTIVFVVLAVVSVVAARFAGPSTPKPAVETSEVGTLFYPDFKDADAAKALEVTMYNADTATVRPFAVTLDKDGIWRIPYAHNYPADGKDRLAKTAASMIGIKREGFAGRLESQHADFGVLDPKSEVATDLKGIGNRITLKDASGKVLADYIIGKEVKGTPGVHYIRRPDQKATYRAKVDIQVSTKFADWIEADLLKLDAMRLNAVAIDTTTVDFSAGNQGAIVEGEVNRLSRKTSSDPWKLEGLDEAKEEINQDEVRKMVSALDDLKIVGIRRKPARLMQGLRDGELKLDQLSALDLETKGFYLQKKGNAYRMIPKDGTVLAVTDQGVLYDLKFGEIFSGTEEEVEVGLTGKEEEKKDEKKDDAKKDDAKSLQKSRYLFVTVQFDPEGLGPRPLPPVKPQEPSDQPAEVPEGTPADATAPTNTAEDPKKVYEAALVKYDLDQKKYEADVKAFAEKIKAGEKMVKELNARFADWYYVVSGTSFENLRQGRKTLVKDKTAAAPANSTTPPGLELPPGLQLPPGN